MKHISDIIDDILTEWAYQVNDGMPDVNNPLHMAQLEHSLYDLEFPKQFIVEFIQNLREEEKFKAKTKKGRVVDFNSEEARDDAIDAGTHFKLDGDEKEPEEKETKKGMGIDTKGGLGKDDKKTDSDGKKKIKYMSEDELRGEDDNLTNTQLTLKKGDPLDKGGQGTPESRTGETVTVWAGKKVQELMKQGLSYEEARKAAEEYLMDIANQKDTLLTKEWVQSGLNCLDWIENNIGLDKIAEVAWDTDEGNKLVGSTGHGTSADMFVKTKNGDVIGISLKKDFKVFIVNGGYASNIKELGEMLGAEVPENVQGKHYNKRRTEVLNDGVSELNKPHVRVEVCKNFNEAKESGMDGSANEVFADQTPKRVRQVALKKLGISEAKFKKLPKEEQSQHMDGITCDDVYDHVINDPSFPTESIKVIANLAKQAYPKLYDDVRALDNEMADNMFEWLQEGENKEKFKDLVKEETHILDVLFGSEGALDKLEVLYGEEGGVTMSPEAVSNLFGISDLYNDYKAMEDGPEKEEKREEIENQINEKLVVTKDKGKPVISVRVTRSDGTPYEVPIFGVGVRARGIGASPSLEIFQSTFGSLAFKNGNVDIESWPPEDRKKVSDAEAKSILSDIEDEQYDLNNLQHIQEIKDRLEWTKSLVSKDSSYIKKIEAELAELEGK